MVEEYRADVVEMAIEGEQTSPCLIRPDLDLVVITTGDEEWLCFVEVYSSYWTVMFLKSINQCAHPVVPKLNRRGMQGH